MKFHTLIPRIQILIVLALIISLGSALWSINSGKAASTIQVNSFEDVANNDGQCTLREAISSANKDTVSGKKKGECLAGSGADTIILPAGTYTLTRSDSGNEDSNKTGDLDVTSDITITGDGAEATTINAIPGFADRIFHVLSGSLEISGVAIESGNVVKDSGGAIENRSNLILTDIRFGFNYAATIGGAIYNTGTLEVRNSSLSDNYTGIAGGGIYNLGDLKMVNVTISGNGLSPESTNALGGGGLVNAGGTAELINVTIANNGANVPLGAGGNLHIDGGNVSLVNTLLANPLSGTNCFGSFASQGNNLSSDNSCVSLSGTGDMNSLDAKIGSLTDNGGQTLTHALLSDSPAIDAGANLSDPLQDQRGIVRPFGANFDIGAYEATFNGNDSWTRAQLITPGNTEVYIEQYGLSRWFKFEVNPGQQVVITLKDLPANYDMTLYKDITQAYIDITNPQDLTKLDAEFAPDAFSPDAFSPDAFSPDAFSPDAFSPDAFSPDAFSPDAFSPDAFSPDAFSPDAFSPDAFSPDAFSPDAFSPDAFSPDAFSPDAFSPDAFSPDAFSSAQTRSLIAVSAFEGTANEGILINTWDNDGYFYIRVRGRNGIAVANDFALMTLIQNAGQCGNVSGDNLPTSTISPTGTDYSTIILWDSTRMIGGGNETWLDPYGAEIANLETKLDELAVAVNGVVVDVNQDARVQSAKVQADSNLECPYAVNLWAESIEEIIDGYWETNPLEYVVLIGNDDAIPFFREPDHAMLANEKNYVPPVKNSTTSQASLKLGFVLSQDRYGSAFEISLKESDIPIPSLGVGRLVETTGEITTMLDAYAATNGGVVQPSTPNFSTLVTGYDFLTDSAEAIRDELNAGTGGIADELIAARDLAPAESWTAEELRNILLGERHDLIYLAGHFSANSALAADYATRLSTSDLISSSVDLSNSIIFSPGCHSGYNIVDPHDVPGVTRAPDWAQAFAQKGATLIAGTGYQYGDTDFIEYSERLYLELSRQIRVGTGPVPIGKALVNAKQIYLATTPQMRGIHEKAFLEATLFGLPMLSIDMPGQRLPAASDPSVISQTNQFGSNPGATLGLRYADLPVSPQLMEHTVTLTETKLVDNEIVTQQFLATYFSGGAGVVTNPVEPILPLESKNVSVPGFQTRGVGFRGGVYTDNPDVLPLNGAATTEVRGVHTPFLTDIFFPIRFWGLNHFDTLASGGAGITRLNVIPAQFLSNEIDFTRGTLRTYSDMDFRLYFSENFETYADGSVPALSGPPTIANVTSVINGDQVDFQITVLGNPAAGIQEVWVTYTATGGPFYGVWQSLDLVQNQDNTLVWEGTLPLNGTSPDDVRFMVQAVNGVGLVSASTNLGLAYVPGVDPAFREPTELTLNLSQASAPYGTKPTFSATLIHTTNGEPLPDLRVLFRLGSQTRVALTDVNGIASVEFPLLGLPGDYELKASFPGDATYATANASTSFTITKQETSITLDSSPVIGAADQQPLLTASLEDASGRHLSEKTIFFTIDQGGNIVYQEAIITDYAGRASLGNLPLDPGTYNLTLNFSGNITLLDSTTLSLNDDRYNPSSTGAVLIISEPPVTIDDAYTTNEDIQLIVPAPGVLSNDTDPDGETLTVLLVSDVSNGTLVLNTDGSFTYTPSLNYFGQDSFTYLANDGYLDSEVTTVNLTVLAVNDAPTAVNDTYSATEDTALTIVAPGVLSNDTDIEGSTLSSMLVLGPQHGTLTLEADGSFVYLPESDFNGTDSFAYKANDGEADSNTATVTINVGAVNDAPLAVDDSYVAIEDETLTVDMPGVLANDSDPDGDTFTAQLSSNVTNGTLILNSDGSFTYTPNTDFYGIDSFTYVATDGNLVSNLATVTINVASANDEPDCSGAYPSITSAWPPNGDFVSVYILGITDPDGDPITITIDGIWQDEPVGNEPDGRIVVTDDGSSYAEVRVERDGNGNGRVYHIYFTASDGNGGICHGEVVVLIVPHDQGSGEVDGGPLYNSLIAD